MAIETPIVEWAIDQFTKSPQMQSVVAAIIVLLLAFPLIRGALKAVHPAVPPPPPTPIIQETPWLITTVTGVQIRIDQMLERQGELADSIASLQATATEILRKQEATAAGLAALTKLLRKRQGRGG